MAAQSGPLARRVAGRRTAALIEHTDNFASTKWLGRPVWQVADAWLAQECIVEDGVAFVVECGTNRGGSAFFIGGSAGSADQQLSGSGQVLT